ncbi:MAG: glycosyltransferase family 2 protein [bacterium]|nr:glycosyltransferase family 2 protein [bacterium]
MPTRPKVAIVYLSFHSEPYIADVVSGLKKMTYPKDAVEFVIVDNPHPTHGSSARFLEENVLPLSGNDLPHTILLPQTTNLGFAGGNNVGIKWAIDHGFDYVYFHNNDGFVAANFLEPLVDAMETDKTVGAAQSLVLLHPETDLINTSGNSFHYLGIGFCNNLRVKKDNLQLPKISETSYASGAAMLMRVDLLKQFGIWDEDFFLYHEDIEYSFRLRMAGYKIIVAADSIFYHKYAFSRNKEKFYYIERNRFGVMLMFFKWPTLLLFLPMAIILEIGMLLFAWRSGWLDEKIKVYKYWLNADNIRLWLGKRTKIQQLRKIKDADLIKYFTGKVIFEEKSVNSPLLIYVGNPLMNLYWQVVKKLIIW